MLVFGDYLNGSVYALNLKKMEWIKLNDINYNRYGHTANILQTTIYLFGGGDRS